MKLLYGFAGLVLALTVGIPVAAETPSTRNEPNLAADLQYVIDRHRAWVKKIAPGELWKKPPCTVRDALFWYTREHRKHPTHHFIVMCSNIKGDMVVVLAPSWPDDGLNQYYESCYQHYFSTRGRRWCLDRITAWYDELRVLKKRK